MDSPRSQASLDSDFRPQRRPFSHDDDEDDEQQYTSQRNPPEDIFHRHTATAQGLMVQPRILQSQDLASTAGNAYREQQQQHYVVAAEEDPRCANIGTPLASQYSNLVSRSGSRYASNGFRATRAAENNPRGSKQHLTSNGQDQYQILCAAHIKSLSYSTLYSANSIVYSQNVPIIMNNKRETNRQASKFLRMEIEVLRPHLAQQRGAPAGKGSNGDVLYLTLSDDSNPLFLFISEIDLPAFLKIRKEQNIFVEFSQLAEKAQALFDLCIQNRSDDDLNRFACVVNLQTDSEQAVCEIFEHNEFRNLLHLRLEFKKASAEETAQWAAKKLLMQRKLNVELQQECTELFDQHEQDRQRIGQIKQSLIALKATQNEELQRIKEDHEAQLDHANEAKETGINQLKATYESQIQELTTEFEERLQEIKTDAESLRLELQRTQESSKHLSDAIQDKEEKIEELTSEVRELQSEKERILGVVSDLKESVNVLERSLLEETLHKEALEKEVDREQNSYQQVKLEMQVLQEQNQANVFFTDQLKEKLIHANEQKRFQEADIGRYIEQIQNLNDKIDSLKEKKERRKQAARALKEEKAQAEGQAMQLQEQVSDLKEELERSKRDAEAKNRTLEAYQTKLKEDQATLLSNKNLIEYLNRTINEAQKYSFRTMLKQKAEPVNVESRFNTISPLRTNGLPPSGSQSQLLKNNVGRREELPSSMVYKPPCNNQLSLPLTEFYLSKGNNYLSFGGPKPRETDYNQFSAQLERERIISEDKLKQRESAYRDQSSNQKYHLIGSQQRPQTAQITLNERLRAHVLDSSAQQQTLNEKFERLREFQRDANDDDEPIEESTIRLQRPEMDDDEV